MIDAPLDDRRRNEPAHEHREEDGQGKNKGESIHNDLGRIAVVLSREIVPVNIVFLTNESHRSMELLCQA
jgi:hypothetical protein